MGANSILKIFIFGLGFLMTLIFPSRASGQLLNTCTATKDKPIVICFHENALELIPCKKEIGVHFTVARLPFDNGVIPSYYFTYKLIEAGTSSPEGDPLQGKYLLTEDDAYEQYKNRMHIPLGAGGNFSLEVTVYAEGRSPVRLESKAFHLYSPPVIRAIIVGVSNYELSSVPKLLHSDDDAKAFDVFLKSIAPLANIQTRLLVSSDPQNLPTATNITSAITAEKLDSQLCTSDTSDDWFIFYFSGHGIVGSNKGQVHDEHKAVTRHYISTFSLDPANLTTTALTIESVLNQIRELSVDNKLIIFDSCFSGSSIGYKQPSNSEGKPTKASRAFRGSAKIAYVYGDQFVDPFQPDSNVAERRSGDLNAFHDVPNSDSQDGRHVLILAASQSNYEAEEGFAWYAQGGLRFVPSEDETDEQKPMGHGLYSYTLLWNLITQLPEGFVVPRVLNGKMPVPSSKRECSIDFRAAHTDGASDIHRSAMQTKHLYQTPEIAGDSGNGFPPFPCSAKSVPNVNAQD